MVRLGLEIDDLYPMNLNLVSKIRREEFMAKMFYVNIQI